MNIYDIIKRQEDKENSEIILVRNGKFYQGYNAGAFALAHLKGYAVKMKQLSDGTKYYRAGFPSQVLSNILKLVTERGGEVVSTEVDGSMVVIKGVDTRADDKHVVIDNPQLMVEPRKVRKKIKAVKTDVEQIIIDYDIANKTPMECMTFLNDLRNYLLQVRNKTHEAIFDRNAEGETATNTVSTTDTAAMVPDVFGESEA